MAHEICHNGAKNRPAMGPRDGRAAAVRVIRRSGRRPALRMGAGLSAAGRCGGGRGYPRSRWWKPRRASPRPGSRWPRSREALGDRDGARSRRSNAARDADREDYHGARLHLARLGVGEATPRDDGGLCAPAVRPARAGFRPGAGRAARLSRRRSCCSMRCGRRTATVRLGSVLDLGCGTGLGGAAFRPHCDWLVGRRHFAGHGRAGARQRGSMIVWSSPSCWNSCARRSRRAAPSRARGRCLCLLQRSCADRWPLLPACWRRAGCSPSPSRPMTSAGVRLRETLRYAHGAAHVRDAIAGAGLDADRSGTFHRAPKRARRCRACWW